MMIIDKLHNAYENSPLYKIQAPAKRQRPTSYKCCVDRQIIITGRGNEIDLVVQAVMDDLNAHPQIKLPPLSVIDREIWKGFGKWLNDPTLAGLSDVDIRLYDLTGDESEESVWGMVRLVHQKAAELGYIVLADPNLIFGNPGSGGAGGVTGGPTGLPVDCLSPDYVQRFWNQWAFTSLFANGSFRRHGINLEKRNTLIENPNRRIVEDAGSGMRVFVLDTADDQLLTNKVIELPGTGEMFPINVFPLNRSVEFDLDPEYDISAHGRFICGLLHRVAPMAEINLFQVLDNNGRGELFTLTCVLLLVAAYGLMDPSPDYASPMSDAVINLSLAADLSEDHIVMGGVRTAIAQLWEMAENKYRNQNLKQDILYQLLEDIFNSFYYGPSLRIPIMLLNKLGAVIVAAAGNDSAVRYGNMPALVPARYPEVIGVGASNMNGDLSSFSNTADIRAPGGGHENPEYPITYLDVLKKDLEPYAICSLVPKTDINPHGLAYWWGTSFSTPLVTGLAALVRQVHRSANKRGAEPESVKKLIKEKANRGIIDVEATLAEAKK